MPDMHNPLAKPPFLLEYKEERKSAGEDFLVSEEDDQDDSSFVPPIQMFSSPCLSASC